jgi:HSP20 family protein
MALMRWRDRGWPFSELEELRDEMDRIFDRTFGRTERRGAPMVRGWVPSIDMFDRDSEFVVKADIPGMSKEDIDISVKGNMLTISGEQKSEEKIDEDDYHYRERTYGKFQRNIALPQGADAENIKASYKDGTLEITMPQTEGAKPKKIEVAVE